MPNILSIETSSACCSVCIKTDHLETQVYENNAPNTHGEIIFEFIKTALQESEISKEDIDYIVFGSGPGSFTGLRVGCSVVQGLGYGLKVPIIPISSLRITAQQAIEKLNSKNIVVINDAHMEELYVGEYKSSKNIAVNLKPDYSIRRDEINELVNSFPEDFSFIGNAMHFIEKDLQKKIIYDFTPKANFSFNIATDLILNQKFVPAEQVKINYLSGESQWKRV